MVRFSFSTLSAAAVACALLTSAVAHAETPLNNLYMAMLDRIGAPVGFIGDSTGRLPSLTI